MGLDEINKLGELGTGALLGIALILVLLLAWRFLGGENSTKRLTLIALTESVKALTAQNSAIASLDDSVNDLKRQHELSYADAARTMADVTTRREADFEKGVNTLRADIGFVPDKVGNITEVQIDTIRTALAALLAEQEARVGKRIDELADKYSDATLDIIRAEIEAMSERIVEKIDNLTEIVPEKVGQVISKTREQAADDTLAATRRGLVQSEKRGVALANENDELKKRGTGPLADTAKPPADDGHGSKE